MNKDVKTFVRELRGLGFEVEVGSHVSVCLDGRRVLTLSVTPSDRRWRKNAERDLKRVTGIVV